MKYFRGLSLFGIILALAGCAAVNGLPPATEVDITTTAATVPPATSMVAINENEVGLVDSKEIFVGNFEQPFYPGAEADVEIKISNGYSNSRTFTLELMPAMPLRPGFVDAYSWVDQYLSFPSEVTAEGGKITPVLVVLKLPPRIEGGDALVYALTPTGLGKLQGYERETVLNTLAYEELVRQYVTVDRMPEDEAKGKAVRVLQERLESIPEVSLFTYLSRAGSVPKARFAEERPGDSQLLESSLRQGLVRVVDIRKDPWQFQIRTAEVVGTGAFVVVDYATGFYVTMRG